MVSETLKKQVTILELLNLKKCTRSAEIIPPRNGSETNTILEQIETLKSAQVDFISVTKGAGGSLRGGTLPIAQIVKSHFNICSLAHFTCRDYTIEEVENALMDHHYFGITNILALRGDPPDGKPDHFSPQPNRHTYAWQLINQIKKLNSGEYIVREGYDQPKKIKQGQPTQFCIGAAAYPEHEPFNEAISFLQKKVDVGAQFAITQMLFDPEIYAQYLEACAKNQIHIPIIPGLRILTQSSTAERMRTKFGVRVPSKLIEQLSTASDKQSAKAIGLEFTHQLCRKLLSYGAPGIHLFIMNDAVTATELLKNI